MSNNWIVENIQNALGTWNDKLNEIWRLLTESPESFKGGAVWNVMVNINGTLKAVGYALLVLFFLMGIMKHYNSFSEVKRPEQAIKLFLRFVLAKAAITWGLDLMMAIFRIVQGVIGKIMTASGIGGQGSIVKILHTAEGRRNEAHRQKAACLCSEQYGNLPAVLGGCGRKTRADDGRDFCLLRSLAKQPGGGAGVCGFADNGHSFSVIRK